MDHGTPSLHFAAQNFFQMSLLPQWLSGYSKATFTNDLLATLIVMVLLIPQSLGYAMVAGLPPQAGLYASIVPPLIYAFLGTSRTLAIGPAAILALMTGAAAGTTAMPGTPEYLTVALILSLISGCVLIVLGLLRLGFVTNFLSHSVISGFMTSSALIIAASQVKHLLGIKADGFNLPEIMLGLFKHISETNIPSVIMGAGCLAALYVARRYLKPFLLACKITPRNADLMARAAPVLVVILATSITALFQLENTGIRVVGAIPKGLPALTLPSLDIGLWSKVLGAGFLIALVSYVESISIAQTFAARRRLRINPDQELIALGGANLAAGLSGGFPVTGSFSRSVINFDAGAETQVAGILSALGIVLVVLFFSPLLYHLPQATLAATIIVAVLPLADFKILKRAWRYARRDFVAILSTIIVTLGYGVEGGLMTGVLVSILLHLYFTSRPHFAVVGLVPGTHHFRNVERHKVLASERVVSLRIDESLYFADARFLEDTVYQLLLDRPQTEHIILMCMAVNLIDLSALESLEAINARLRDAGVKLHLSHVKGPVMDRLKRTHFLEELSGHIFLSHYEAIEALDPAVIAQSVAVGLDRQAQGLAGK